MYYTLLGDKSSEDLELIAHVPIFTPPERQYKEIDVLGRDGKLYEDLNTFSELVINQEFEFIGYDLDDWNIKFRQVKKWINNSNSKILKFSDDLSIFYIVNRITIDTITRDAILNGKFKLTYYCNSYCYLTSGLKSINLSSTLKNNYYISEPIYNIKGEGLLKLVVNEKEVTINVGQNTIIDVSKQKCYKENGENINYKMSGKYKDLVLKEGINNFSFTSGFTITIIPNWRYI